MNKIVITLTAILLFYNWLELSTAGGLGFIRNNLAWIVIIIFIIAGAISSLQKGEVTLPAKSPILGLGFMVATFPFFFNLTDFYSYGSLLPFGLLGCLLCFCALFQFELLKNNKDSILLIIVIIAFAEVLIGSWQLFNSLMMQLTSEVEEFKLIAIDGTFNQRNVFASFISSGLLASTFLLFFRKSIFSCPEAKKFLLCFLFLGCFLLYLTNSRVGIYSFIAGHLLLTLTNLHKKKIVLKTLILTASGFVLAISFSSGVFQGEGKDFTKTHNRQLIYSTAVEAIGESPLLGHGLGSFEKVYLDTLAKRIHTYDVTMQAVTRPENLSHPHNELLYWGVQGGIVSILGLIMIVIGILAMTWRSGLRKNIMYYCLLLPIGLHLMVELPFYISGVHIIVALLVLFYVVSSIGEIKVKNFELSSLTRSSSIGTVSGLGVFLGVTLFLNSYSIYQANKFEKALNRTEGQLQKVVVTVGWADAYQSLLLKHRANIAVKKGEKEAVVELLDWLETQNQITPRLQYFFNIYYSYQILGNHEKAAEIKSQIEYYYKGVQTAEDWLYSN